MIRQGIRQSGGLSFARFMELALYQPEHGYYERAPRVVGRGGDFYTSVSVGGLFGELLGRHFAGILRGLDPKADRQVVEAGAHDGKLARDILNFWREHEPDTAAGAEYWIIEPSVRRRGWQQETLAEHAGRVRWFESVAALPESGVNGIIFANELLDAFPVRRVGWDAPAKRWFEWGVVEAGDAFAWCRLADAEPIDLPLELPPELLTVLPDGFTTEIGPAAVTWWRAATGKLRAGQLLTLDYGLSAEEFFRPERAQGTLRAYREHRLETDVLGHVGEQDLTAHVNFTAVQRAGEAAGLRTVGLTSQTQFLTAIAEPTWKQGGFPEWTSQRVRQFQTLTHPEHLGRAFRVLVQVAENSKVQAPSSKQQGKG
jgi:SAM-dependent MidA family methyltransferase